MKLKRVKITFVIVFIALAILAVVAACAPADEAVSPASESSQPTLHLVGQINSPGGADANVYVIKNTHDRWTAWVAISDTGEVSLADN